MSNISSLLNPEPSARQSGSGSPQAPTRNSSSDSNSHVAPTTFEAADALTTLATLGSNVSYANARDLPSPVNLRDDRRQSSLGSHATPVEPSPPTEHPQPHSPTLEHYHHGSKSPEDQRRQSMMAMASDGPTLAPIKSLSSALNEQIHEEPHRIVSYGHDASQMVPPSQSSQASEERDITQNRKPAFVRDEPTTSQIREPSLGLVSTPHLIPTAVPLPDPQDSLHSPAPIIKAEPGGTPREGSLPTIPQSERKLSLTDANMDADTLKAIEAVKQSELGLRAKGRDTATPAAADPLKAAVAPSKKRPAPKNSAAANKKGTAARKPASKKRKLDPETASVGDGANARRSGTPVSRSSKHPGKKMSHSGTPAGSSPAPDRSSQAPASDDEGSDESDDNTLYCICRRPDNHQWMIACDGGCDDWFHGACVNIQRVDENLIDKYICPNCESQGKGCTTWKPMCRRDGCRQPARLTKGAPSKYCSDECGVRFFKETLARTAGAKKLDEGTTKPKKAKKKNAKETEEVGTVEDEDEEPVPLGGVLRSRDLKSLTTASQDLESFRRLGSGVLSPPATVSPTKASFSDTQNLTNGTIPDLTLFTQAETAHLAALNTEKVDLQSRLELLKDREKFVTLARDQASRYAEREKLKPKDVCGYDNRLAWTETEFALWRASRRGRASLKHSTLSPTPAQIAQEEGVDEEDEEDLKMDLVNGGDGDGQEKKEVFCTKKRCNKHNQWQKLNLQDARFEEVEVAEGIRRVEREEREVRERAGLRARRERMVGEVEGVEGGGNRREGWVERVG